MASNFRQYMAETGQQSTLDELERNFKFGEAEGQYNSQGWYGVSPEQRQQQQAQDAANAELARQKQLTDQAIGTLQSQQPKIGEIYNQKKTVLQSQIDPIKQRYDALISELKGNQQTSEEQQTLATSREMAKRGLSNESGMVQQERVNTLNPIRRSYAGLTQQTGLAQEADIKAINDMIALLSSDQLSSEMSLAGLISQAQMGGAGNALAASGQLFGNAQAQANLAEQRAQAQAQQNYNNQVLAMQQALQPGQILSQDLANQLAQYNLNNKGKTAGNTTLGTTSLLGGNTTTLPDYTKNLWPELYNIQNSGTGNKAYNAFGY